MRFELQRADFWKRISALMFDIMMLLIVAVIAAVAMSAAFKYDKHVEVVERVEQEYVEKYGIIQDISEEEFAALSKEEKDVYYACDAERQRDPRLIASYNMLSSLKFVIPSMSILIAYALLELGVPILFKNGQTLGKKAFGLGVVHTNGVRIRGQAHFIRSIIGKCLIEALVPFYFFMMIIHGRLGPLLGVVMILLIFILEIFTVATTRTRSAIHDLIADTAVVDLASQMVFEDFDALVAYKAKIHEEMANKQEY